MVSVSASEPGGREFYPGLCSYSVFAIICNEFARQACGKLAASSFHGDFELAASLHSCHDKFVASLHSCHDKFVASLLQTKIAIWERRRFRLTKNSVVELTLLKHEKFESTSTLNNALSAVEQVLIALRFYAVASMQLAIDPKH
ncbi:hypothetical protein AVEN_92226-1 [Araneus ventricosus]|uniref:Uncharacterized protein n=1 Tax=Araneus ventricosus TaxID=182803 RepID=A0A4Y2AKC4_ARAVE|nr:hypothetical protein AVEN_92226-1 [Araneus ventricosus]